MELKAIEQLLEKYLEAETSVQEEAALNAYFASNEVAPHLQEYAPMFAYFSASRMEGYSGERGLRQAQPDTNEVLQEDLQDQKRNGVVNLSLSKANRRKVYSWVAVAASIVLMAGVFLQEQSGVSEFGSYEDPEVAMEETKRALDMVSQLMNSGNDNLVHLNEFNNTKNKLLK